MQISTEVLTNAQGGRRGHKTQAERRAETRTALLDATIECLVTYGYAGTTTVRIAKLANLSRGAQTLYFPTRAELVSAAVAHLAEQRVTAVRQRFNQGPVSVSEALDALWEEHQGTMFQAALELWVASRTDPELREGLHRLERDVAVTVAGVAENALGDVTRRAGFAEDLVFALSTIRGLALLRISNGGSERTVDRLWEQTRERLVRILS